MGSREVSQAIHARLVGEGLDDADDAERVGQRVVVLAHLEAAELRNEGQSVCRQAERSAGHDHRAEEAHVGPLDVVHGAGVADHADVEARVVSHHHVVSDVVHERGENGPPPGSVPHRLGVDAMKSRC